MSRRGLKRVRLNERGSDILRVPRRDMVKVLNTLERATGEVAKWKRLFLWTAIGTAWLIGVSWVYVIIK